MELHVGTHICYVGGVVGVLFQLVLPQQHPQHTGETPHQTGGVGAGQGFTEGICTWNKHQGGKSQEVTPPPLPPPAPFKCVTDIFVVQNIYVETNGRPRITGIANAVINPPSGPKGFPIQPERICVKAKVFLINNGAKQIWRITFLRRKTTPKMNKYEHMRICFLLTLVRDAWEQHDSMLSEC